MAKLSPESKQLIINLKNRLLDIVDESKAVEFAVLVHLGQNGPQASGRLCGAGGGVGDQGVLAIQFRKRHDWFGDELPPESVEGCLGLLGQRSSLVAGVLPG